MRRRRLFVTNWIIQWDARYISKPFPDRGIKSTACLVLSSIDYSLQYLSTKARNKSQAKFQEVWKQIWTQTLFKRSEMFGSGSLAQRTTNFSVTVTRTVQKFPRQTPSSCNKKQTCLPWHNTKLPTVLKEKLFCSNSPPQINITCSRHTRTHIMCNLHQAAHTTESLLFPLLSLYKSTNRASCQMGSLVSKNAMCASCSPIMVVMLWANCPYFSLW